MGYHKRKTRITLHRRVRSDKEKYTRYQIKKNAKIIKFCTLEVNDDTCPPSVFMTELPNTAIFCVSDRFVIKDYECKTSYWGSPY
jgi:hypothetical protein